MSRFSFHRGSIALDFAGTLRLRGSERDDRLVDRGALAAWLREAGLCAAGTPVSDADLAEARMLREAIAGIGAACTSAEAPSAAHIAQLNAAAAWGAGAFPVLGETLDAGWAGAGGVRPALARIAADAVDLFARRRDRLVRCELDRCGALVLSHSRGPRRRWCSMETCGNVVKAAAHRARRKAGVS